jgi:predicted AlkP superfamily phosphohydrolase/phosphomutase
MRSKKKVVLIGIDAATLGLFKKFSKEGYLPNIKHLMEHGVYTEAFPAVPPATSVNWNTIITGAYPKRHGVTSMSVREKGSSLWSRKRSGFFSYNREAETLWETAENAKKRVILLKYPTSWPPTVKDGIQVGGFGDPNFCACAIGPRLYFTNDPSVESASPMLTSPPDWALPKAIYVKMEFAKDWKNVSYRKALQTELRFPTFGGPVGSEKHLYCLVLDRTGNGYDRVIISEGKETNTPLTTLYPGEWGNWIRLKFMTGNGEKWGNFRFKIIELPNSGGSFRLYCSQISSTQGWTVPEQIGEELIEKFGPYQSLTSLAGTYGLGWIDEKTIIEEFEYQIEWLGNVAEHLLSCYDWDLFCTQWHGIDHLQHVFLGGMDPKCIFYVPEREKLCADMIRKGYELADYFVGKILGQVDKDTLVVVTSDHGCLPVRRPKIDMNKLLSEHGLLMFKKNPGYINFPLVIPESREIDWARTKACEILEAFIHINLKGREPDGIVKPGEEYRQVCNQIIDILQNLKDPEIGENSVAIVLKKEDAEILGLGGDHTGDIVYLVNPNTSTEITKVSPKLNNKGYGYTGNHHGYAHFARFEEKIFSNRAASIFFGPEIPEAVERNEPINLVDIAPTMSKFLDIPCPAQSEGKILF